MKIALFSDVHGRLRVVLHMMRNWQMAHKCYLDGALIAGDLGCFPDIAKVDKATRRRMEGDPEEAGFSKYFVTPRPDVEKMFLPKYGEFSDIRCPINFVPGNHEDFAFLNALKKGHNQQTFPVGCYRRFNCIQDAAIIPIHGQDGTCLRVAGIWGIENTPPLAPYKINLASIRQLESLGHQACQPADHLFGHVHSPHCRHQYVTQGARTKSFILKDVSFGKTTREKLSGSLGLLDWDGTRARVSVVADDWLQQMRYPTWEQVWPEAVVAG